MSPSLHAMAGMNGSGDNEPVDVALQALFFHPRPYLLVVHVSDGALCLEAGGNILDGFKREVGPHSAHLTTKQFMFAHHPCTLLKILWLVIGDEDPCWLLSWKQTGDAQPVNIVAVPVKSTHGEDVTRAVS